MFVHAGDATSASEEWDGRRIAELTRQLKEDSYARREGASRELAKAPVAVLPILERLAQDTDDPESRQRLQMAARMLFLKWIAPRLPEWKMDRGYLGITWETRPKEAGVLITGVTPQTAADRAGLQTGDVILAVNGQRFKEGVIQEEVMHVWRQMLPDDRLNLVVKKKDQAKPVKLMAVVGPLPKDHPGTTSGKPSETEKVANLWMRYRQGRLRRHREAQDHSAVAVERNKLQSWPSVLQSDR